MGLEIFERGTLPPWALVRQRLDGEKIADGGVGDAVAAALAAPGTADRIQPGQRVAVTAGSRGIDRVAEVLAAVVAGVRARGGEPFIVPAMGSHAGATAESQVELLHHYGVTEAAMGCPIRSSMDVVQLGTVEDGVPVWFDRISFEEADAVIPVGRVKAHTDFRGPIESGLCKMMAIGLGKQRGADTLHARSFAAFRHLVPAAAEQMMRSVNIPFGVALVENGYSKLAVVEAVPHERILAREPELLVEAKARMARLAGDRIDVLLLDLFGKNISGAGADPNVTARDVTGLLSTPEEPLRPNVQRVVVRDLTPETEGNAAGIGYLDFVLQRAADKVDRTKTYMNQVTSKMPAGGRLPIVADSDRQAIALAIASAIDTPPERARIARIPSTKDLEYLWVSEPLLADLLALGAAEQAGDLRPIAFDADGMLDDAQGYTA
jgi:hypothetical protein